MDLDKGRDTVTEDAPGFCLGDRAPEMGPCLLHKAIFDNTPNGIIALDSEGRLISANCKAVEAAPCLGRPGINVFKTLSVPMERVKRLLREGTVHVERRLDNIVTDTSDGDWGPPDRIFDLHAVTMENEKGFIVHFQDVTDRRRAERESKRRKEELDFVISGVGLSYWERDVCTNAYRSDIFDGDAVDGDPFYSRVHPGDLPRLLSEVNAHVRGETPHYRCEFRIMKDGRYRWYMGMGLLMDDGHSQRLVGFNQDIDSSKTIEEDLQRSVEEKTEMLREIHHRVNNNLQILKAMVELRLLEVEDLRSREELTAVEAQIMTMAMAHRSTYGSEDLRSIPAEEHFRNLLGEVIELHRPDGSIRLEVSCDGQTLTLPEAAGCSFILNELTSSVLRESPPINDLHIGVEMWCGQGRRNIRFLCNQSLAFKGTGEALLNRLIASQLGGTIIQGEDGPTDWTISYPSDETIF